MKRTIVILMMILGVSVPSLAQQTVKEETNYIEHMITRGETFASIAKKYGITEQQLRDTNPKYKTAYAGLKLRIPQQQATTQAPVPQPSQPQQASLSQQASSPQPDTQPKQIAEKAPISGPPTTFALSAYNASVTFDELIITDPSGNILFEDHFTNNDGKWLLEHDWGIENGVLICKARISTYLCTHTAFLGDNYDIQVKAKRLTGYGPFIIAVNVKDKKNCDYIEFGDKIILFKNSRYVCSAKSGWSIDENNINTLKVSVRNGEIMLGYLNHVGVLASQNAQDYYSKLAKTGDGEANCVMGILYGQGHIGKVNLKKAIPYYKKAAEAGFTQANYLYALCMELNGSKDIASEWYMKGIDKGDAMACYGLAKMYYDLGKFDDAAKFIAQAVGMSDGIDEVCRRILKRNNKFFYESSWGNDRNEFSLKYPDAVYAHDFASYRHNPNKEEKPFFASAAKDHPLGCQKLAEVAEQGNYHAIKQYTSYLWTGELKNISQNKKKAVDYWQKTKDQTFSKHMLIVAKGSGLYNGEINKDWYYGFYPSLVKQEAKNGNVEAAAIMYRNTDREYLQEMVKSGNFRAAELMDELDGYFYNRADVILLFESSQKTKYDKYLKDLNRLKSYYDKAYSLAAKSDFEKIDKNDIDETEINRSIELYKENPQYDKQNYKGKAQKLIDFLLVYSLATEDAPSPKKFTGRASTGTFNTLFGITYPFFSSDAVNSWIGGYNHAISTCQSKNQDSRFANFYKRALPILKKKKEIAQKNIEIARADYDNVVAKERTREYEQQTKGKAIDWDRCEEPSGDLCRDNLFNAILDVGNYTHKNNGIIRFKNGHRYKYNIIYDSNKRFSYYSVEHVSGEFKSKKEMIDAIIKRER